MKRVCERWLATESCIILGICALDLVVTIWLVRTHRAVEGNPLMSYYLDRGWNVLVEVKLLLVLFPIFVAEWGRRYRPHFVRRMLRLAIAVYVGVYVSALADIDILASVRDSVNTRAAPSAAVRFSAR